MYFKTFKHNHHLKQTELIKQTEDAIVEQTKEFISVRN